MVLVNFTYLSSPSDFHSSNTFRFSWDPPCPEGSMPRNPKPYAGWGGAAKSRPCLGTQHTANWCKLEFRPA